MSPAIIVLYLVLCVMVSLLGSHTRLGFLRSFFFSVMLTPFLVTIFLLILATIEPEKKEITDSPKPRKTNP